MEVPAAEKSKVTHYPHRYYTFTHKVTTQIIVMQYSDFSEQWNVYNQNIGEYLKESRNKERIESRQAYLTILLGISFSSIYIYILLKVNITLPE